MPSASSLLSSPAEQSKSRPRKAPKRSASDSPSAPAAGAPGSGLVSSASSTPTPTRSHTSPHTISHLSDQERHKRVWKACERCRMKKTKCDGETPCRKCRDDGLICTAGVRKKMEFRQLPKGYAEVLEGSQMILVSAILKLFDMLHRSGGWELGEVDVNTHGRPVVHHIADLLGCIRRNTDLDLPERFLMPENEENMEALAQHLRQQRETQEQDEEEGLQQEQQQQHEQQQEQRRRKQQQEQHQQEQHQQEQHQQEQRQQEQHEQERRQHQDMQPLCKAEPKEESISPSLAGTPRYQWHHTIPDLRTNMANNNGIVTPDRDRSDGRNVFGLTPIPEPGPTLNTYGHHLGGIPPSISSQSLSQPGSHGHVFDSLSTTAMLQPSHLRSTFAPIYTSQGQFQHDMHMYQQPLRPHQQGPHQQGPHQQGPHQQGRNPSVGSGHELPQFQHGHAPGGKLHHSMLMGSHDPVLCPVYDPDGKPCIYS